MKQVYGTRATKTVMIMYRKHFDKLSAAVFIIRPVIAIYVNNRDTE